MREIKFRQAILNKDGTFREWRYWGFIEVYGQLAFMGAMTHNGIEEALKNSCQYTGLKDSKGNKIFEGDIFTNKILFNPGVVVFLEDRACFGWECGKGTFGTFEDLMDSPECEIIGNIYENPELWWNWSCRG